MDALEKAHALRPDHGPTLVDLAYAFNADGRHSQAQDALQRAAKLGPLSDRGRALGDRMAQKMDRAATVATRQVDLTEKVAYEKAKRLADRQQNRMDLAVMKQENAALAHENEALRTAQEETPPEEEDDGEGCELEVVSKANGILTLVVELDGVTAKMTVDTGASRTVVSQHIADELELEPLDRPPIKALTANGITTVQLARIEDVTIGGVTTGAVEIGICRNCPGTDGLLGGDMLRRYGITIDPANDTVWATECGD